MHVARKEYAFVLINRNSLIESGAYEEYKKIRRTIFKARLDIKDNSLFPFSNEETDELRKMYEAHKKRNRRMYEKLCKWLFLMNNTRTFKNYHIIFVTLTFTDQQLKDTSQETRRRYVVRYLSKVAEHYIANIDFGAENGREHYHALVFTDERIDRDNWDKKGFSFYEEVVFKNNDYIKVIKYLNKLTNHSFKDTNKTYKVIYDRNEIKDNKYRMIECIYKEELRRFTILNKRSYL